MEEALASFVKEVAHPLFFTEEACVEATSLSGGLLRWHQLRRSPLAAIFCHHTATVFFFFFDCCDLPYTGADLFDCQRLIWVASGADLSHGRVVDGGVVVIEWVWALEWVRFLVVRWGRIRWWRRQGHASLRVTSSRGHVSARAIVLTFAKLRAFLVDTAEASVVVAFALKIAKTLSLSLL
ncbi:hypothetical protein Dsin_009391 [Dipteronia sinensis]|uniref:Uncharacterized protein n=1 Tax=Dipteronia sinensis TaxID=43782 RepID=A0AAE0EBP9_9ROSI|nr:hypothetical protein Dsin_009391 [Dipteronia sinensis]